MQKCNIPFFNTTNHITDKLLMQKFSEYYNEINNIIKEENITLSERIWLYQNNLTEKPLCPNCKKNKLKFIKFYKGYRKFCSKKCAAEFSHKNEEIKYKRITNMLKCNYDKKVRLKMTLKANNTKKLFSNDKKVLINEKRKNTVILKYGVDIISKDKNISKNISEKVKITKRDNKYKNLSKRLYLLGYSYISNDDKILLLKSNTCGHEFNIHETLFNQRNRLNITVCTICNPVNNKISDFQIQVKKFIESIYTQEIIDNYKIKKYEIDIFLPKLNLGFECNGLWWHSEKYKEKEYHINKYNFYKNNGIRIINIWEDWWKNKNDIMKSIISNKLNINKNKIYARKCEIKEIVDNKLIVEFLNENHIQGYVQSKIKIGLFYNDELVSLMTFGQKRIATGNRNGDWELIRFCVKKYNVVIGGASKLFKYFTDNYNFSNIITYADISLSNGDLYKKLNMKYVSTTSPNYYYFHKDIGIRHHRFNFRKDILVKQGFDKNKTEHEIMFNRNYYRIYDCGNLKFEYIKNETKKS